jgi:hypothetical protein
MDSSYSSDNSGANSIKIPGAWGLDSDVEIKQLSYLIITREKGQSNSMIMSLLQSANLTKTAIKPALYNVMITNTDDQLLVTFSLIMSQLADLTTSTDDSLTHHCDASDLDYYQMLYQCWRLLPGHLEPRTLIISGGQLLLCEENLNSRGVKLKLLDSTKNTDVWKIQLEEDSPLKITLIINPSSGIARFSRRRKWRLQAPTKGVILKLLHSLRNLCPGASSS